MRPGTARGAQMKWMGVALVLGMGAMGGCQGGGRADRADAVALYERGKYNEALTAAMRAHGRGDDGEKARAALVVGMAARELGRDGTAKLWLGPLTHSDDPLVAGRASATLGLVALEHQDYAVAAQELARAGRLLKGAEAGRANFLAGESYAQLGQPDTARLMYRLAQGSRGPGATKATRRLGATGYRVQLGAFRERGRAENVMKRARARAVVLGLGEPTIEASADGSGRVLYVVRLGDFRTQQAAQAARLRMGNKAVVVAAAE